jgi:hypothetical protein
MKVVRVLLPALDEVMPPVDSARAFFEAAMT